VVVYPRPGADGHGTVLGLATEPIADASPEVLDAIDQTELAVAGRLVE
jgi:hypothetical protein